MVKKEKKRSFNSDGKFHFTSKCSNKFLSFHLFSWFVILVSAFFCLGDGDQSTTMIWNSTNQMGSWMPTISSVSPVKLSTNCKYH